MPITWSYGLNSPTPGAPIPFTGPSAGPVTPTGLNLSDLALDPATGDIAFPPHLIFGAAAVAQRVGVRFKWFLGEWFLDQREGVPYFRDILVKSPDPILISSIFRQVLLTTPGILRVNQFNASLDRPSRTLTVSFNALLDDGAILSASAEPFIVTGTPANETVQKVA